MHVLFNATNLRSEGGIVLMQHLLEEFLAASDTLMITLYLNPELTARVQLLIQTLNAADAARIAVVAFRPRGGIRRFVWEQLTLPQLIRSQNVDLLFSFGNTGPRFPGCKQVLYLQQSIPYSSFRPRHGRMRWQIYQWLYGWLIGLAQGGSARIIVPTRWLVAPLRRSILGLKPVSAYHVTLPGIPQMKAPMPTQPFAPHEAELLESLERWRASDEKILLYPCYLAPYKQLPYLLEAIQQLLQQPDIPPFRLLLTFNADSREYFPCKEEVLNAVRQCGSDRVILTGSLCRAVMSHVYRLSDILAFPSLVETLGLPLLEAMAHGIPIVATQSTRPKATQAAFAQDICGPAALYADPQSPVDFARQLARLLHDPELAFELGQHGLQRAQQLSWQAHVQHILDIDSTQ